VRIVALAMFRKYERTAPWLAERSTNSQLPSGQQQEESLHLLDRQAERKSQIICRRRDESPECCVTTLGYLLAWFRGAGSKVSSRVPAMNYARFCQIQGRPTLRHGPFDLASDPFHS
jgi:hypothetical protein